jgi:hypothetical protein
MTMYMIVFGELVRAYGARSMRLSLFQIGVFSNPWMQPAVFSAVGLTFFVGHVPGVRDVFDMQFLTGREYAFCLGLCPLPLVVDEIIKTVYRRIGYGVRPKSRMLEQIAAESEKLQRKGSLKGDEFALPQLAHAHKH